MPHPMLNRSNEDYNPQGNYDNKIAKKLAPWMELFYSSKEKKELTCDQLNEDSDANFKVRAVRLKKGLNLVQILKDKKPPFADDWNAFCADYPLENLLLVCDYHGDGLGDIVIVNWQVFNDIEPSISHMRLDNSKHLEGYSGEPLRVYLLKDFLEAQSWQT